MNEIEYMLRQDAREKKAAGRGIYHKRSGSKSTYVGLPSDHLTAAEKKRRNGPMLVYNLNKRLSYAEFKALPNDLASEYLNRLYSTYNVGLEDMAESMGATKPAIIAYLRKHNISHPSKKSGPRKIDPRWGGFVTGKYTSTGARTPAPEEEATPIEEPKPAPIIPEPAEPPAPAPKAQLGDLDLGGSGTPEAILDMLMTAFASLTTSSQTYEFAIHLHAEGDDTP